MIYKSKAKEEEEKIKKEKGKRKNLWRDFYQDLDSYP